MNQLGSAPVAAELLLRAGPAGAGAQGVEGRVRQRRRRARCLPPPGQAQQRRPVGVVHARHGEGGQLTRLSRSRSSSRVSGVTARVSRLSMRRIDSTHSTWMFDTERMRFCRLPRGVDPVVDHARQRVAALLRARDRRRRGVHRRAQRRPHAAVAGVARGARAHQGARAAARHLGRLNTFASPSRPEHAYDAGVISSDAVLAGLNPVQREAASAPDGPIVVIAGAGSGKTRVLTHRIAFLIAEQRVSPFGLAAITFTNKAAGEMKDARRRARRPGRAAHVGVDLPLDVLAHPAARGAGARLPVVVLDLRPGRRRPPRRLRAARPRPRPEALPAPSAARGDLGAEERAGLVGAGRRPGVHAARRSGSPTCTASTSAGCSRRPRSTSTTCWCRRCTCSATTPTPGSGGARASATCWSTSSRTPTSRSGSSCGCSPRSTAT